VAGHLWGCRPRGVAIPRSWGTVGTHKHRHPLFSFSCPHTLKHAMFSGKKPCSQGAGGWRCLCVHTVHWEPVRAIRYSSDDLLLCPRGLKFFTSYPQDGTGTLSLIVAHAGKGGASIFSAIDGRFISHVPPTDLNRHHSNFCVYDVEEGDGGWLLACGNSVRGRPQALDAHPGVFF
jgi:hypothetical protein